MREYKSIPLDGLRPGDLVTIKKLHSTIVGIVLERLIFRDKSDYRKYAVFYNGSIHLHSDVEIKLLELKW